jgi:hypothetical protein
MLGEWTVPVPLRPPQLPHTLYKRQNIGAGNVTVICTEVQVRTPLSDLYNTECSDHGLLGSDTSHVCREIPMFQKISCLDLQAK